MCQNLDVTSENTHKENFMYKTRACDSIEHSQKSLNLLGDYESGMEVETELIPVQLFIDRKQGYLYSKYKVVSGCKTCQEL